MSGTDLVFNLFGKDHSASKTLKDVGDSAEGSHGRMEKFGKGSKLAGLAVLGAAGMAAGAMVGAAAAGVAMAKGAMEDEAAQKKLAIGLKNTAGATDESVAKVEAWISKTGLATGVADDQMRPAFQRLVQATGDVGKAQDQMRIAMDVSAGSGKSLETVTNAMAKAQDGNMGALAKLGVKIKDTNGDTLTFDQTMKNMAGTFEGQSSAAANTLEGKVGRLKLAFDETKETIGAKLIPIGEKLSGWIVNSVIPAAQSLAEKVLPKLRDIFDSIKKVIEENKPGLEMAWDMFKRVAEVVVTKVLPVFARLSGEAIKLVIKAFAELSEVIPPILSTILDFASQAIGAFKDLYTSVTGVLEGILTVAERTMGWIPGVGDKIKTAKEGFSTFRDTTITKLGEVEAGLKAASTAVGNYGEDAKNVKKAELKADLSDLQAKLTTAKAELKDPELSKDRKPEIKADIEDLKDKISDAKARIASVDGKTVKVGVNVVVDGKTVGISDRNGNTVPMWKIQGYAKGGVVTQPTIALIGEAGPEAIIPLGNPANNGTLARVGGGGGGDVHYHFHSPIIGSREDMARYVTEAQKEYKRRRGGTELGIA